MRRENNLQVFVSLLYAAQHRISITSPYFVPDGSIMNALRAATARGVEVELFVSEIGDQALVYHAQRSYYEELLNAGVRHLDVPAAVHSCTRSTSRSTTRSRSSVPRTWIRDLSA